MLAAVCCVAAAGAFAEDVPALTVTAGADLAATPIPKPLKPGGKVKTPNPNKAAGPKAVDPNKPASKEIPIPLPIGEKAMDIKIPQVDAAGVLMSLMKAAQLKRIDDDHVEIQSMNLDLNQPDGKTDFHIIVPTCVFNLKTRIIHSDYPVVVKTREFELTGEKMEFDTVERSGKLIGKVHMLVHNLKQVAGQNDEPKNP